MLDILLDHRAVFVQFAGVAAIDRRVERRFVGDDVLADADEQERSARMRHS